MFDDYDAGLLNDYGGGDVDWWHGYLRSVIDSANENGRLQLEQALEADRQEMAWWMHGIMQENVTPQLFVEAMVAGLRVMLRDKHAPWDKDGQS